VLGKDKENILMDPGTSKMKKFKKQNVAFGVFLVF
jgi:hypothetical protein